MIDPAIDRGGLKDSENAPNSFFPKINRTVFWRLGTDMPFFTQFPDMYLKMSLIQKRQRQKSKQQRPTIKSDSKPESVLVAVDSTKIEIRSHEQYFARFQ